MSITCTRMAGLVLVFGFFFGCSASKQTADNPGTRSSDHLSKTRFDQRMKIIDEQLQSDRNNSALYYEKGTLLIKWAKGNENPADRFSFYEEADSLFQKADSLTKTKSAGSVDTRQYHQVRRLAGSSEHNQGIRHAQNAPTEKNYRRAAIHFNNAAALLPDRADSYKLGSQNYYKANQLQHAIDLLERARLNLTPLPVDLMESLGFLYVETEQLSQAIMIYKEARSRLKYNFNLMHGLSNAYVKAGDHQNAISLLQQLSDQKPQNITYRLLLASESYKAGRESIIAVADELEDRSRFNSAAFSTADSLFSQAEHHYTSILDSHPDNVHIVYEIVQFYQNKAAQYQRLTPHLDQEKKKEMTSAITDNVAASVPLLEQITEQKPTDQLWEYLYRTYSFLGMQTEAEQAKANF